MGDGVLRVGDRVMQMRNNYDIICQRGDSDELTFGVFNGDTAAISAIDPATGVAILTFDDGRIASYTPELLQEIDLAYAITVHKSQGSEFPVVVLVLYDADPRLLSRNLLYTAVTRAKNQLVIVGSDDVFARMVANNIRHKRYSALHIRLRGLAGAQ
jgi:exodeoxyribonuclease V alpha subunit